MHLDSKLVSVIMPAFNAAPFVQKAIYSVLNQSYRNLELLVGIDGATDDTLKIVQSINDSRIRIFQWKKNRGNVFTCNELFANCKGDFIAIQDADDWSHEDRLQQQINYLNNNPNVSLVGTGSTRISPLGIPIGSILYQELHQEIKEHLLSGKEPCFVCASIMIRADVYKKIGGYREFFNGIGAADYDWVYRISEHFELGNISTPLYFNLRHEESFTKAFNKNPLSKVSHLMAYDFFAQRLKQGYDVLSRNQEAALADYLKQKIEIYDQDSSLIYSQYAERLYGIGMYHKAVIYALMAVIKNPIRVANFSNLLHYSKKMLRLN